MTGIYNQERDLVSGDAVVVGAHAALPMMLDAVKAVYASTAESRLNVIAVTPCEHGVYQLALMGNRAIDPDRFDAGIWDLHWQRDTDGAALLVHLELRQPLAWPGETELRSLRLDARRMRFPARDPGAG